MSSVKVIFCTYCSKEKNKSSNLLPSIERYKSKRIRWVYEQMKREREDPDLKRKQIEFTILSGQFGLLEANEMIPDYDHLLTSDEVDDHIQLLVQQIKTKKWLGAQIEMHFYHNSPTVDPNLVPYVKCIASACDQTGIRLFKKEFPFGQFDD